MNHRRFDPWIGSRYYTEGIRGIRLLILGESHYYVGEEEPRQTFTIEIVRMFINGSVRGRWRRFFTVTQRLVSGGRGYLSEAEREDFWERVAFYNYIQSFPGPTAPRDALEPQWLTDAQEPFRQTLHELNPQLLLVLGLRLSRNLPHVPASIKVCSVKHPSSRGFRYNQWQPVVQSALNVIDANNGENLGSSEH